jgi:hypothetical protein
MSRGFESHTLREGTFRNWNGPSFGVLACFLLGSGIGRGLSGVGERRAVGFLSVPPACCVLRFSVCTAADLGFPRPSHLVRYRMQVSGPGEAGRRSLDDKAAARSAARQGRGADLAPFGARDVQAIALQGKPFDTVCGLVVMELSAARVAGFVPKRGRDWFAQGRRNRRTSQLASPRRSGTGKDQTTQRQPSDSPRAHTAHRGRLGEVVGRQRGAHPLARRRGRIPTAHTLRHLR